MVNETKVKQFNYRLPDWFFNSVLMSVFGLAVLVALLWAWNFSPFPYRYFQRIGRSENVQIGSIVICVVAPLVGALLIYWRSRKIPQLLLMENGISIPSAFLQRQTQISYSEITSARREVVGEAAALVIRSQKGKFSLLYDWMDSEERAAQFEEAFFERVEAVKGVNHR